LSDQPRKHPFVLALPDNRTVTVVVLEDDKGDLVARTADELQRAADAAKARS
jgi:hypothetical protein